MVNSVLIGIVQSRTRVWTPNVPVCTDWCTSVLVWNRPLSVTKMWSQTSLLVFVIS